MLFMVYPQLIPSKTPPISQTGASHSTATPSTFGNTVGEMTRNMMSQGSSAMSAVNTIGGSRDSGLVSAVGGVMSTANAGLKAEFFEPKIFGFKVNEQAKLNRWRMAKRDE